MNETYLIKIGEISLKGGNRRFFEQKLKTHIKFRLRGIPSRFEGRQGRFFLTLDEQYGQEARRILSTSFGVTSFSRCLTVAKDTAAIQEAALALAAEFIGGGFGTAFKVEARRSDKSFPMTSYELAADLGGLLLENFPELTVNVKTPDWILHTEIREKAILYGPPVRGLGGLPVGSAGRGLVLLSGGIDSPAAAFLMAKRGLKLDCVYFHAYPYTSDQAREKVVTLARILAPYCGGINLYIVPFTPPQLRIRERGPENQATLLMRAAMVKVADTIAGQKDTPCLITGESLSQVASQTVPSIAFTNGATDLPIFRPLIGMDKEEIIALARRIGTYETSILPYEDCCSIFSPDHPVIRPDRDRLEESYAGLDMEPLLAEAVEKTERIYIAPREGIGPAGRPEIR